MTDKRVKILGLGLAGLMALPIFSGAQTSSTCAQYQNFTIATTPSYIVQTNYWNKSNCPTTQCMWVNTATGDFAVTAGNFNCNNTVATYPSIFYGCHYGTCSPGTNLPMPVSLLTCVRGAWTLGTTNTGYWDAAYDIWFSSTTNTSAHSAELMIWLAYPTGTGPGGSLKATNVSLAGYTWNVYEGPVGWNYIAYLATSQITSFDDADLLSFMTDSVSRGYIQSSWYLDDIEAGNELRSGGVPFTSTNFNVSVNGPTCGTPTPPYTPTPTPTDTPCGFPGLTCTPTQTPIPTDTPTATPTPFPNVDIPWPNPWDGSQPVSIQHSLSTPADWVHLKVYTLSFRKIYENDNLENGKVNPKPIYALSWDQIGNVADGLYYIVIIEKRGRHQTQKVLKLLVRR